MRKSIWKRTAHIFVYGLVGAAILVSGCSVKKTDAAKSEAVAAKPVVKVEQPAASGSARVTPIVLAAKKVGPAVVGITTKAIVKETFPGFPGFPNIPGFPQFPGFEGGTRERVAEGAGSGVIYDAKNGYIATNNHVVEGAKEIKVHLTDGRSLTGKVLGTDPATDLAVVKVDAKDLPEAPLGDSSTLQVGEPAIAIGNPLGMEFRGTVTVGIISALNRSLEVGERKYTLIQTDAAINPGNSGGALVNADGEVMGINSAKIAKSGVEGIGFAIPINTAKPILEELVKRGVVARPYLGVTLIDKATADKMGFEMDLHGGVFMMKVLQNSPAGKAGIRPGDIILSFNGEKVTTAAELREKIAACKVGATVDVKVLRGEVEMTKKVTLEEVPEEFNK